MTGVVAIIQADGSPTVVEVAAAVADLLQAEVRAVDVGGGLRTGVKTDVILRELRAPDVTVVVMADGESLEQNAQRVLTACPKPLVVAPARLRTRRPVAISRVLMPLDGTWEAAAAVAPAAELFARAGVHIVILHVFDQNTVPPFWDQAAHARRAWEGEFLARYCPPGLRRLRLRSGAPGEHVVAVAEEEDVDLIALGWSQRLNGHRARTVRATLTETGIPVILMPVSNSPEPDAADPPAEAARTPSRTSGR